MGTGKNLVIGAGILAAGAGAYFFFRKDGPLPFPIAPPLPSLADEDPRFIPVQNRPATYRGERNNNPTNLTPLPNGQTWQGQVGVDYEGDQPYLVFETPRKGIRAGGINALTYYDVHHLTTLREIGQRWGPRTSSHYGEDLARTIGIDADAFFNVPRYLESLVKAISINENSEVPYTQLDWSQGVQDALAAKGYT